ncbi:hypothetical protein SPBR_02226 [Sporothrix brasiliensis 5110]|uniref:chitinase n=1 Tax=Sporothrix brasiliensis 5110 TaxID=1398154 RepID=A0A0C2IZP4_9PEZI|nr:uncharacterized protein SPBR_02226 [Sporothrix brasiliensis 5110]KIH92205.1 hypothetical protein SPBR_02226 [Sporothrix brasiliensis 5110]
MHVLATLTVLASLAASVVAAECSATQPCAIGCCSKYGNCGLGPDYCAAANCVSSCGAKSECDPGGWGLTYANATACPLNVCCSAYGFCGTTPEFCGTSTVAAPTCDVTSTGIGRVVGYYEAWATTERPCNGIHPEQIPQGIYTHVNFAFASIDPATFTVVPAANTDSDLYQRLQAIKTRDLGLQTWISIGGWTFNDDDQPTRTTFSDLAASATNQEAFFASLLQFMQTWGFTGVDIDWEYPEAPDRNGRGEDFTNFPVFLQRLRGTLDAYGFGLSVTLPSSYWYLQHFDLPRLQPWVDWFNVLEYDLHGTWDIGNQWTGAFLNAHTNLTEIRGSFDLLWRNNVDPAKINLGLAMYGRSTTVASAACTAPGCPYLSGGDPGQCSEQTGILLNSEIESIIAANGLAPTLYADAAVKTISWGANQWVSFDDADTWKIKGDYAKSVCLGGVMVWAISHDDIRGTYAKQLAGALGRTVFIDPATNVTAVVTNGFSQVDTCQWSNCGAGCPTGFAEVPLSTDPLGGSLTDGTGCFGGSVHTFCCPKTAPLPVCALRGFQDSGVCNPGCAAGEAEVGAQSKGCAVGYQSACCPVESSSMAPYGACAWFGAPPLCSSPGSVAVCPSSHPNHVVSSTSGQGGAGSCWVGAMSYCCTASAAPNQFTECAWNTKASNAIGASAVCEDSCPSGELLLARQQGLCALGNEAYCCKGPSIAVVGGLGSIGNLGLQLGLTTVGGANADLAVLAGTDLETKTADILRACLQGFFLDPTCPALWASSIDEKLYGTISRRGNIGVNLYYQYDCITEIMSAEISSPSPSEVVADAWNEFQSQTGVGYNQLRVDVMPFDDGQIMKDPLALISEYLCDPFAAEKDLIQSSETAEAAFCEYPGLTGFEDPTPVEEGEVNPDVNVDADTALANTSSLAQLISRKIQLSGADNRDRTGNRPTVVGVLNAINNGVLGIYYLRWINLHNNEEIILEIAYTAVEALAPAEEDPPAPFLPDMLRDNTHTATGNPDNYIIFHLHIPIDGRTLRPVPGDGFQNWYPGVSVVNMYHGQVFGNYAIGYDTIVPDDRVQFRRTGGAEMLNSRTVILTCNIQGGPQLNRWYLGRNNIDRIRQLLAEDENYGRRTGTYATLLNTWAINLFALGVFSPMADNGDVGSLNSLWPTVSRRLDSPRGRYQPRWLAFDRNWQPYWP